MSVCHYILSVTPFASSLYVSGISLYMRTHMRTHVCPCICGISGTFLIFRRPPVNSVPYCLLCAFIVLRPPWLSEFLLVTSAPLETQPSPRSLAPSHPLGVLLAAWCSRHSAGPGYSAPSLLLSSLLGLLGTLLVTRRFPVCFCPLASRCP